MKKVALHSTDAAQGGRRMQRTRWIRMLVRLKFVWKVELHSTEAAQGAFRGLIGRGWLDGWMPGFGWMVGKQGLVGGLLGRGWLVEGDMVG